MHNFFIQTAQKPGEGLFLNISLQRFLETPETSTLCRAIAILSQTHGERNKEIAFLFCINCSEATQMIRLFLKISLKVSLSRETLETLQPFVA